MIHPLRSLRTKIILMVGGVAAGVALLVGGLNYVRTAERTLQAAVSGLAGETRLMATRFVAGYNQMENDAFVVAKTPPIEGMVRSMANQDVDPLDQSTTTLWRTRLETIFISIMQSRPHYTQMRYIGLNDKGRELVRVNRQGEGFERVAPEGLQQKADEGYFKDSLSLKQGEVYFSDVTYNREQGQIDSELLPTVRTVLPIFYQSELFGFIVINADYPKLLTQIFNEISPDKNTFIVNQSGDYMEYQPLSGVGAFQFHGNKQRPQTFIEASMNSSQDEQYFIADTYIDYLVRLRVSKYNPDVFLGVVLRVPKDDLLAAAYETRRETMMLAALLIILSLIFAIIAARRLSAPLMQMTENISNIGADRKLDLPVDVQDEVGELARSFEDVFTQIGKSEAERERLITALEESNAELEEFAYRTSHDLRSPLVSSIGLLDTVHKAIESDKKDVAIKGIAHVETSLKKLEILVKDILALTKTKNIQEAPQWMDIEVMTHDAIKNLSHMENADRLNFKTSIEVRKIKAAESRLILLIENLISNAIKYQDTKKTESFVHVSTRMDDGMVALIVEDNGIGIPKDKQNAVFSMFKRFHPKTAFGSGLGMYMMKKSAEMIGGSITYKDVGHGSRFTVHIPYTAES
ncbi:MAG: HAMP domain-containing histidine kinase [Rickettsiales bacterium]|nr:HAMP domain-containing histidine kinase [Rickettsiales bacterium]